MKFGVKFCKILCRRDFHVKGHAGTKAGDAMEQMKNWEELKIKDNFLFQHVMKNRRLCKQLIEKILHIRIRAIKYPEDANNGRAAARRTLEEGAILRIDARCECAEEGRTI